MRERLDSAGYRCVSQVMEHGEFAVRGSLLDLFPMGSEVPFRIDLFDDEIDNLALFDPLTGLANRRLLRERLAPLVTKGLVAGGTGFLGSTVADAASRAGFDVHVLCATGRYEQGGLQAPRSEIQSLR